MKLEDALSKIHQPVGFTSLVDGLCGGDAQSIASVQEIEKSLETAAFFDGNQIVYAPYRGAVDRLEKSLDAIRRNITKTIEWRSANGFPCKEDDYSYVRIPHGVVQEALPRSTK